MRLERRCPSEPFRLCHSVAVTEQYARKVGTWRSASRIRSWAPSRIETYLGVWCGTCHGEHKGTKSGLEWYILVRNDPTIAIVTSGRQGVGERCAIERRSGRRRKGAADRVREEQARQDSRPQNLGEVP